MRNVKNVKVKVIYRTPTNSYRTPTKSCRPPTKRGGILSLTNIHRTPTKICRTPTPTKNCRNKPIYTNENEDTTQSARNSDRRNT